MIRCGSKIPRARYLSGRIGYMGHRGQDVSFLGSIGKKATNMESIIEQTG
jgi:hypothetical protein